MRAIGGAGIQVEADQPGDVVRGGAPRDLGRRALLHHEPVLEHQQPVGEHECLERVVRDEQARPGEVGEVALELGLHVEAGARVEGRERLVEQQQRRVAGERPGERDPLRLPAGQVGRSARAPGRRCRAAPARWSAAERARRATQPAGARRERHVVAHAEVGEEPVVLEDETHGAPRRLDEDPAVGVVERRAAQDDAAGRHRGQARHRPEQRALPGAVGSEHGQHLAGRGRERGPQGEPAAGHAGVDDQPVGARQRRPVRCGRRAHPSAPPRSQRSRSVTSTTTDTSSSTRLSRMAASGSVSRA